MKTYEMLYYDHSNATTENFTIIVGEIEEIKAVYRSMCKANERGASNIPPMIANARKAEYGRFFPKFTYGKLYVIHVDSENFTIINSDTVLHMLVDTENFEIGYRFKN